jgi:hypothetical protein
MCVPLGAVSFILSLFVKDNGLPDETPREKANIREIQPVEVSEKLDSTGISCTVGESPTLGKIGGESKVTKVNTQELDG